MNKKLLSIVFFFSPYCFASQYSEKDMKDVYQASFRIHAYNCLKCQDNNNNFYNLYCKNNNGIFNSATKVIGKAVSDILTNNDEDYFWDKENDLILFKISPIDVNYTISNTNALLLWNVIHILHKYERSLLHNSTERYILNLICKNIENHYAKNDEFINKLQISSQQILMYMKAIQLKDYMRDISENKDKKIWKIFKEHKLKNQHITITREKEKTSFHISFITYNTGKLKYRFKIEHTETGNTKSLYNEINELLQDIAERDEMKISQNSEYFVKNVQKKNQDKVYEIISKFRFPSILNKNLQEEFKKKFPKRDLLDTFQTAESELEFLNEEIKKIEPEAEVFSITKSLYEMIAGYYVGTKVQYDRKSWQFEVNENEKYSLRELFLLENYANKADNSITKGYENHMKDARIKYIFWTINEFISQNFTVTDVANTFENTLRLIKENQCIFGDILNTNIQVMLDTNIKCDDIKIDDIQKDKFINFVKNIICCENNAQGYVLYHAYSTNEWSPNCNIAYESTMSLSNGIFSGIFDATGSAINIVIQKTDNMAKTDISHLIQMQLSRRCLLENAYPIFIPCEHAVLAAFGTGEIHHPRTKISKIRKGATSDTWKFKMKYKLKIGWKQNETPEYFAISNPSKHDPQIDETIKFLLHNTQIVNRNGSYDKYLSMIYSS